MSFVFFFNDTATTEIYTLSLHDALPISRRPGGRGAHRADGGDLRLRPRPRLQGRPLAHGGRRLSGVRRRRERHRRRDGGRGNGRDGGEGAGTASRHEGRRRHVGVARRGGRRGGRAGGAERSEEHTSELQSLAYLV